MSSLWKYDPISSYYKWGETQWKAVSYDCGLLTELTDPQNKTLSGYFKLEDAGRFLEQNPRAESFRDFDLATVKNLIMARGEEYKAMFADLWEEEDL